MNITPGENVRGQAETDLDGEKAAKLAAVLAVHRQLASASSSRITACVSSRRSYFRQPGYLHIPVHSWSVIHSGQFSFHHGISLAAAPSPAGRVVVHQAASARLSVRSVVSVLDVVHTSSQAPSGCLSYGTLMFSRIAFLHLLRVPCGTGQSASFRAAIICGFFRCPKKFALSAATSRACGIR